MEIFASQGAPPVSMTGVVTPASNLPSVSTTPVANLPPVSTTMAADFATNTNDVIDTVGKFATGVNSTGGNLPPVSKTPAVNLANNWNNIRLLTP